MSEASIVVSIFLGFRSLISFKTAFIRAMRASVVILGSTSNVRRVLVPGSNVYVTNEFGI